MKKGDALKPNSNLKLSVDLDYLSVRAGEPKWYSLSESGEVSVVAASPAKNKVQNVGDPCLYNSTTFGQWIGARVMKREGTGKAIRVELNIKEGVMMDPTDATKIKAPEFLTASMGAETENREVCLARVNVRAAETIEEAQDLADAGQLEEAREHLDMVMNYIRVLVGGSRFASHQVLRSWWLLVVVWRGELH